MVGGSRGGIWTGFPLSARTVDGGVIGRSGWWAVVRSGTVYERGGNSSVIVSSVDEETVARRVSLDLKLWSYLLEVGFGVGGARESVLGGEGRSTLGPASDIRGIIRVLLVWGQDGREGFKAT